MRAQPILEEMPHVDGQRRLSSRQVALQFFDAVDEPLVFRVVLFERRIATLTQQLFFMGKMRDRVGEQTDQRPRHDCRAPAGHDRRVKIIGQGDQPLMLRIDAGNSHAQIPGP